MSKPISFYLPDDLINRLDAVAAEDDRSRSAALRRIVEQHLRQHSALTGKTPAVETALNQPTADTAAAVDGHFARHARLSQKVLREGFPMTERE
jgi:metal-responsive CopG/Arc/MetJ family transcriptional regulator